MDLRPNYAGGVKYTARKLLSFRRTASARTVSVVYVFSTSTTCFWHSTYYISKILKSINKFTSVNSTLPPLRIGSSTFHYHNTGRNPRSSNPPLVRARARTWRPSTSHLPCVESRSYGTHCGQHRLFRIRLFTGLLCLRMIRTAAKKKLLERPGIEIQHVFL